MKNFNQKRENRFPFMHRFLAGMIIALSLTLTAFEWTTIRTSTLVEEPDGTSIIDDDDVILPPIMYRKQVTKPSLKKPSDQIEIVKEIITETKPKIEPEEQPTPEEKPSTEDLSYLSMVDLNQYGEGEDVNYIDDNIPYTKVEIFAHYDNCADLVGDELMECSILEFSSRIKKAFKVSEQLKDIGGRQAANMSFVVDKEGNIHSITVLASSSKAIERDAIRAIETLPRLNPAMQQGRAVPLQLTIPIQVHIQN